MFSLFASRTREFNILYFMKWTGVYRLQKISNWSQFSTHLLLDHFIWKDLARLHHRSMFFFVWLNYLIHILIFYVHLCNTYQFQIELLFLNRSAIRNFESYIVSFEKKSRNILLKFSFSCSYWGIFFIHHLYIVSSRKFW